MAAAFRCLALYVRRDLGDGQTLTTLETTVNASQAMVYKANGLFQSIGTTFMLFEIWQLVLDDGGNKLCHPNLMN